MKSGSKIRDRQEGWKEVGEKWGKMTRAKEKKTDE